MHDRIYNWEEDEVFEGYDPQTDGFAYPTDEESYRASTFEEMWENRMHPVAATATDTPTAIEPGEIRFEVRRPDTSKYIFLVVDSLTNTVREVTKDPLDAAALAQSLNDGLIYNLGKRWMVAS
jgi:hypothetical protein